MVDIAENHVRKEYNIEMSCNNSDETSQMKTIKTPLVCLESWVQENMNKDCIKFYKAKGSVSSKYPQISDDKYLLLIMTKPQMDQLKKSCEKLICIDRQDGKNFEIMTLFVLDDTDHSFPCASLVVEKIDEVVVEVFFVEIKSVIGSMSINLLMSGKSKFIVDAWNQIIGQSKKELFCSWDILKDWKTNIFLIKNREKQRTTYRALKRLMKETDKDNFVTGFNTLLSDLTNDPESTEFALYMVRNYLLNLKSWGPCFLTDEGIKVNYQLEHAHLSFRQILLVKNPRKLDRTLSHIFTFVRSKVFDRLVLLSGGIVSSKLSDIYRKHNIAQKMNYEVTNKGSYWIVESRQKEKNKVRIVDKYCQCQQKCSECNVCHHVYNCTCLTSNVRLNICSHIHYVCTHEAAGTIDNDPTSDGSESDIEIEDSKKTRINNSIQQDVCTIDQSLDDNGALFDNIYEEIEVTSNECGLNQKEMDVCENVLGEEVVCATEKMHQSSSFESRKIELENIFKSILHNASDEKQLQEIEKALCILQDNTKTLKPSPSGSSMKRSFEIIQVRLCKPGQSIYSAKKQKQ